MTIKEVINKAIHDNGFTGDFDGKLYVTFDSAPLFLQDDMSLEAYYDKVRTIPGVVFDEGQGDGYCFEIDAGEYTMASQRRLLSVIEKTRKRNKHGQEAQGIQGI